MACMIVCGGSPIPDALLGPIRGALDKLIGAGEAARDAVQFLTDPIGFVTSELQQAVVGVGGMLIPWLLSALEPDYTAQWWLQSYLMSFSLAILICAVLMLTMTLRRKKGQLGSKQLLESYFVAIPGFFLGASFGPLLGILIGRLFSALTNALAVWGLHSTTKVYFETLAERVRDGDVTTLLGSVIVSWTVLAVLFLSLIGVSIVLIIQLATQYMVGALIPLGIVWFINPDTRSLGKLLPTVWIAIYGTHAMLILMLGIAFNLITGLTLEAKPGSYAALSHPVQTFVTMAVPAVVQCIVVFAPLSLVKLIPNPFGGGGKSRTSGFTPPPVSPQIPASSPSSPQRAAGQNSAQSSSWTPSTAPATAGSNGGSGAGKGAPAAAGRQTGPAGAGTSEAGKLASAGARSATAQAGGTAATGAAKTAGAHAGAHATRVGGSLAANAGRAAAAATGVGAPVAVASLLATAAIRAAHTASQAATQAANQAVEAGEHRDI